ncbi:uncharacterized protein [Clytia hemisphaerica]|uniref:uncharacterized protein n=1 Tax=Clytia hemisphaerica TaxID=252671 RepID=UPI0034D3DD55
MVNYKENRVDRSSYQTLFGYIFPLFSLGVVTLVFRAYFKLDDEEDEDIRFDFTKSRTRREIKTWYEEVKDAQKAANREELFLRRSIPVLSSEYFSKAHQILPLELGSVLDRYQYFAITKNGTSTIIIAKYDTQDKLVSVHTILFEKGLLNLAVFHGHVNPSSKVKFFAAAGDGLSIYEIDLNSPTYSFIKIQSNPLPHIRALKFVEIKQETFFIIGVHKTVINGGADEKYEWQTNVQIFKYHSNQRYFHYNSMLPGSGVSDIECFVSQTKAYLIVANYRNDVGTLEPKTQVYEYNVNLGRFLFTQSLASSGALDIEHFVLSNEDYIIIANEASGTTDNKLMNVPSYIYRLNKGKFQLLQTLPTYGAKIWKHVPIPNCKQDVLLIYGDQRDNMDQVGIYSFSHHDEMFNAVPFEVYAIENITADFRPQPNSISTFTTRSNVTGKFDFMLVIGAVNTDQGSSMYQISYDIILRDSPMEAFKRFVTKEISLINQTLNEIKTLLSTTETILSDSVLKTGQQTITGQKTVNNLTLDNVFIDTLTLTSGSILFLVNQSSYLADPEEVNPTNITILQSEVEQQGDQVTTMDNKNLWSLNSTSNITNKMVFENSTSADTLHIHNNLNVSRINTINIDQLYSNLVNLDESALISGNKKFNVQQTINSMDVQGKINHLDFEKDVFIDDKNQTITGIKTFNNSITINGDLSINKIMGIDLSEFAVLIDQPATLSAPKTFSSPVTTNTTNITLVNDHNLTILFTDCFRKNISQDVTGNKIFTSITSNENVVIENLINGINLDELKNRMSSKQQNQTIAFGNKIFNSNVTIKGFLQCQQEINEINIPSDVILNKQAIAFNHTQHFKGPVHMKKTLQVDETIAGINTSRLIKTNGQKTLEGSLSFQNEVVTHNLTMVDQKQINGIDFSVFAENAVRLDQEQDLGNMKFTDIMLESHNVDQLNGKSISEYGRIFDSTLQKNGDQSFESIEFANNVHSTGNLNTSLINGHRFPEDFARKSSNHTFNYPVTFTERQTFENDLSVTDSVMNVSIDNFFNHLMYKDQDEIVKYSFTFNNEFTIEKDLITNSTINGVDFSNQLIQRTGNQNITGHKTFAVLNLTNYHVEVQGDLGVSETIDGVDLSDLDLSGMQISRNETITGEKCFEGTDYNRSVSYVNGIDLSALKADIVTLDTDQTIESEKIFTDIEINTNLNTTSTINGVDILKLKEELYSKKSQQVTFENLVIKGDVHIQGDATIRSINNTNITKLHQVISRFNTNNISKLVINGASNIQNLESQSINDIQTDRIIYRSENQTITGHKTINGQAIMVNLQTHQINGIDVDDLYSSVVTKDMEQRISGNKYLIAQTTVLGDVYSRYLNNMNILDWNFIMTKGLKEQTVYSQVSFQHETMFIDLNVTTINKIDIDNFFNQVVTTKMNHTFPDLIKFTNGIMTESLHSTGENLLINTINGLPILRRLHNETLKVTGEQTFCCLTGEQFTVKHLTTNLINFLRIPDDIVTKMTDQAISGDKLFENVEFTDILVNQHINGINLKELIERTLFKSSPQTQTLHGHVTFQENVHVQNLITSGQIGGVLMTKDNLVTLRSDQTIEGEITLLQNLHVETLKVNGTINKLNLTQIYHNAIRRHTNETLTGDLLIIGNLAVYGNINLTGLTNGIDLSNYEIQSPVMEDSLTQAENALSATLNNQCSALSFITNALTGFGYRLDYFTIRQEIPFKNAKHSQVFTMDNDIYLAVSIYGQSYTLCSESYVCRWNTTTKKFVPFQSFPTAGVEQIKVGKVGNQTVLFVMNSYEGCANVQGPLQILSWNITTMRFQYVRQMSKQPGIGLISSGDDLNVLLSNGTSVQLSSQGELLDLELSIPITSISYFDTINGAKGNSWLALAKTNNDSTSRSTLEIYQYSGSDFHFIQSLATTGLSRTTSFTFNNDTFLVVANDRDQSGSYATYQVSVDIYRLKSTSTTFELFQKIPSYKAVDVSVSSFGTQTLLAITHYEQSVSVYRLALDFGFLLLENVPVSHCQSASFLETEDKSYLVVTTDSDVDKTKILEIKPIGVDTDALDQIEGC